MEKTEAIREWCVEKAMTLLISNKDNQSFKAEDVIKIAKELENYLMGKA